MAKGSAKMEWASLMSARAARRGVGRGAGALVEGVSAPIVMATG
jgi:hypothetical protein